jgi:predicted small lipoprotein YifL
MRLKNILLAFAIMGLAVSVEACGKRGNLTLPLEPSATMSEGAR